MCMYMCMYTYVYRCNIYLIHTCIHATQYNMHNWYMYIFIDTYIHKYIHYITLHCITLHWTTLRYTTLHYVTLHYITLHTYTHTDTHSYTMYIYIYTYMYTHNTSSSSACWVSISVSGTGALPMQGTLNQNGTLDPWNLESLLPLHCKAGLAHAHAHTHI